MVNDHGQSFPRQSTVTCRSRKSPARIEQSRNPMRTNRILRAVRSGCILAGLVFLVTMLGSGQSAPDPWLILASGETGSISAHTTREDLVRLYGKVNVVDQDVDIGEGEMQPATFLFPQDPERRIEILWKDPDRRANPSSAEIRGKKSRWHGVHGVSLGTTSTELQHINGRPFRFDLVNDGTDTADELMSWHGGSLQKDFQGAGRVILWLQGLPNKRTAPSGPMDFSGESNAPHIQKMNLRISSMTWVFPTPEQH